MLESCGPALPPGAAATRLTPQELQLDALALLVGGGDAAVQLPHLPGTRGGEGGRAGVVCVCGPEASLGLRPCQPARQSRVQQRITLNQPPSPASPPPGGPPGPASSAPAGGRRAPRCRPCPPGEPPFAAPAAHGAAGRRPSDRTAQSDAEQGHARRRGARRCSLPAGWLPRCKQPSRPQPASQPAVCPGRLGVHCRRRQQP